MTIIHDEQLVGACVGLVQEGPSSLKPEHLDQGWDRLREAKRAPSNRSPRSSARSGHPAVRPWFWALATAGALAAWAVTTYAPLVPRPAGPLQYVVEGVAATRGNHLASLPGQSARLHFSDESSVALGPSTRLHVAAMNAEGAQIVVVDGTVDVYVKHRANTAWRFMAGPFEVDVKGTAFTLGFESGTGHLRLRMTSGLVEVVGPQGRRHAVAAGDTLDLLADVSIPAGVVALDKADGQPQQTQGSAEAPVRLPLPSAKPEIPRAAARRAVSPSERPEAGGGPAPIRWAALLDKGDYIGLVADAERRGLDTVVAQASAADLTSLADAARYTKRPQLALKVLLILRARFAGSDAAKDASFFLARLAETSTGQTEAALGWYNTYLREAPGGVYASETLGREMVLLAREAPQRARSIARTYLNRFPQGPQARLARSLLDSE